MKQLSIIALVAACTSPSVPAKPTYQQDVAPILDANCVRCHGAPVTSTALLATTAPCVRLDRWDTTPDTAMACSDSVNGGMIFGAHDASTVLTSPVDLVDEVVQGRMPKDGPPLTDQQIEILTHWRDDGYQKTGSNLPPTIQFVTPPASGVTLCNPSCLYGVQYVVGDPDGDAVTWSLTWSGNGKMGTLATGLKAGSGTVMIDANPIPSGTYTLTANLDDGQAQISVAAAGTVTVPSGHNASPTVTVQTPTAGASYYQGAAITITWTGNDADDATLGCSVVALQGTTMTTIKSGIVSTVGQATSTTWTAPSVSALTSYTIQVTCVDGGTPPLSAMAQSGAFTISPPPQMVSFSTQLQPIFNTTCTSSLCHGSGTMPAGGLTLVSGSSYAALVNVASKENPCTSYKFVLPGQPDQSYLIFKLQGSGACFTGSQMPKGKPALSPTQIQLFRDWIANNAPNN